MMKKDNLCNNKYKMNFTISSLQSFNEIKGVITLLNHWLVLKFIDTFGPNINQEEKLKKKELLRNVMTPFYHSEAEDCFHINYSLIKGVFANNGKMTVEIFNPIFPSSITFILSKIELAGLIFNKTLNYENLTQLSKFINTSILQETKFLIEQFLMFFNVLKEGLNSTTITKTTEEKLQKSLAVGKKYFDKHMADLKKLEKIKDTTKKKIILNSKFDMESIININNKSINKSFNENEVDHESSNTVQMNNEALLLETVIMNDPFVDKSYCNFDFVATEVKMKSIQIIEDSIVLFFQIASLEFCNINLKKVNKEKVSNQLKNLNEENKKKVGAEVNLNNRSVSDIKRYSKNIYDDDFNNASGPKYQNRSINNINNPQMKRNNFEMLNKNQESEKGSSSTKTNSLKDSAGKDNDIHNLNNKFNKNSQPNTHKYYSANKVGMYTNKEDYTLDTPKFFGKNNANAQKIENPEDNNEKETFTYSQILKNIENAKLAHSFLPSNNYYNVFQNTVQVIHRKFFEMCFEEFFPKIFISEKDSSGLLKLDSLFSFFLYLRGLKNMLFTDKNKIFFSNVFFNTEDL